MKFLDPAAAVVCAESWIAYTAVSSQDSVSLKKDNLEETWENVFLLK